MINEEIKLKDFIRQVNRYFRKDQNIEDWVIIPKHNEIFIQVDFVNNRHSIKKLSFLELFNIKSKDELNSFTTYVYKFFIDDYTYGVILNDEIKYKVFIDGK